MKTNNINKTKNKYKKFFIVTVILFLILTIVPMTVFSWFSNKKRLTTMTKINSPAIINIGAGNKEECK